MMYYIAGIVITTVFATYLSAMNLALIGMSRAALQRKLDADDRPADADWLHEQLHAAILGTALLRTLSRMAIYIFTFVSLMSVLNHTNVTWPDLIMSGLIAAAIIWMMTVVLSTAIARYAGISLISSNLSILHAITRLCRVVTQLGIWVDQCVRKLTGSRDKQMTGADLLLSIEDVQRGGALDIQSAEILENVVEFRNTIVSDVMTPRSEIEGIDVSMDLASIRSFIIGAGHSRIPVYKSDVDHIVGILYVKDLVTYLGEDVQEFHLEPLLRHPVIVHENKPVREVLTDFQHGEVHMAIVIDEFGGTSGLITIEDVLEQIVGDIRDEHEPSDDNGPTIRTIDKTHAEVDGRFRIEELNELLQLDLPEDVEYDTVGGFVMAQLGRVPSAGESFETNNARFTAIAATPTHVQRVGIELFPAGSPNGERDKPT